MVSDDKGDFGYAPLLDAMYAALKDLAADGSSASRSSTAWSFGRSVAATLSSRRLWPMAGRFEGLRLTISRSSLAGIASGLRSRPTRRRRGRIRVGALRPGRRVLDSGIGAQGGDAARQTQFYDRYEAGIAARRAKSPVKMAIPLAKIVVVKES
jgi:salicylate 1-O-methyltransferase